MVLSGADRRRRTTSVDELQPDDAPDDAGQQQRPEQQNASAPVAMA